MGETRGDIQHCLSPPPALAPLMTKILCVHICKKANEHIVALAQPFKENTKSNTVHTRGMF